MLSAMIGLAVAVVSLWGMIGWWTDLVVVIKGLLPLCFFLGGVVAVIAGVSSLTEKKTDAESKLTKNKPV